MPRFHSFIFNSFTKILCIIGAVAPISSLFLLPASATSISTTTINSTYSRPNRSDFEQSLAKLATLPNFATYYHADPSSLDQLTPFAKEYRYLFKLTDAGTSLLANYDYADAREASVLLNALNDAFIACSLLFGTQTPTNQPVTSTTPSTTQQPNTPVTSAAPTSTTSSSSSTIANQTATTQPTAPEPSTPNAAPTHDTTETTNLDISNTDPNIEVPATGSLAQEESPDFDLRSLPYILAAACAIVAIIGFIIASHRHTTYRPGRKIR